jgi:hypothetical protein
VSPNQRRCSEGLHGCRRSGFWEAYSRPLVTASSTPTSSMPTSTTSTSSSTSNHLQPSVCCTLSILFASLPAHAMMDVWIYSSVVFLAWVGSVDPSCIFGVLAYMFLFASSFSGIKLILDHVNFVTLWNPWPGVGGLGEWGCRWGSGDGRRYVPGNSAVGL